MEPQPTTTPRSHTLGAIALATLVIVGGLVVMRQEILAAIAQNAAQQQADLKKLSDKLALFDSRLTAVESAPKSEESATNDKLELELASTKDSLALLQAKLDDIAAKPAVTPQASAPTAPAVEKHTPSLSELVRSGAPYETALNDWLKERPKAPALTALKQHAATGLPTEPALREQFRDIVSHLATLQPVQESDALQKLNTRLAGLITIKKASEQPKEYASLAAVDSTTSLEAMVLKVDALPENARAPFTVWREAVRTRQAALAELTDLSSGDAQ